MAKNLEKLIRIKLTMLYSKTHEAKAFVDVFAVQNHNSRNGTAVVIYSQMIIRPKSVCPKRGSSTSSLLLQTCDITLI